MKTTNKAAILLCAIALSGASTGALADAHLHPCLVDVDRAVDAGIFTNQKDQTRMLQKVENANSKLGVEKYDDAIDKLQDIADKADDLANAPKQKLQGDEAIQAAVTSAMTCINSL